MLEVNPFPLHYPNADAIGISIFFLTSFDGIIVVKLCSWKGEILNDTGSIYLALKLYLWNDTAKKQICIILTYFRLVHLFKRRHFEIDMWLLDKEGVCGLIWMWKVELI